MLPGKKNVINDKLKEFEDDFNTNGYRGPVKVEDQGTTSSPTSLPGPENMIPLTQLQADVSPRSPPESASISDRLLRKKSASYEKSLSLNGVSQIGDLPVMPYCLRQAQDSSMDGPFAPPTAGNFLPPHTIDTLSHTSFSAALAPHLEPVFDTTFRPALPVGATMHGPITFSQCPVTGSPHADMPVPMPQSHSDASVFVPVPYETPYAFQNEHSQTNWIQHGQRNPHGYS